MTKESSSNPTSLPTYRQTGDKMGTSRIRWAAIGAAVAVVLGAGIIPVARAAVGSSSSPNEFVPITPCRIMDTRSGSSTVGVRSTPIGQGESYEVLVHGANGKCNIPFDANAIATNTTVLGGTAASFLTVYPANSSLPNASNLNWVAGQPPTPNQVTVGLSPNGRVRVYNDRGSVNVIVDIVGYYTRSSDATNRVLAAGHVTSTGVKSAQHHVVGQWTVGSYGIGSYLVTIPGAIAPCEPEVLPLVTITTTSAIQTSGVDITTGPCVDGRRAVILDVGVTSGGAYQNGGFNFVVQR